MFSKMNSCVLSFTFLFSTFLLFDINNGQRIFCDDEYNTSSCANTTLSSTTNQFVCRGFLSCKDSIVDTSTYLYCQGDRSCKNVVYENDDTDPMYAYGYQSADSLVMSEEAAFAYCYGYQSCLDIVFDQSTSVNDAVANGYQAMYNSYIDYSDEVYSNGYESLYYATINTTSVNNDEIDITVYGYYGSYETDVICQDGVTCNFYAYGYYATEETYLYCLRGATCNVYCGDTNGCNGMNLYCYSTATCYFDCDDATECPTLADASQSSMLLALNKDDKDSISAAARAMDNKFDKIMEERLHKKYEKQYAYKQERLREERNELKVAKTQQNNNGGAAVVSSMTNGNNNLQSTIIESSIILIIGMFIGILVNYSYNKCINNKDYQYQSIV